MADSGNTAVVIGASGGLGAALLAWLQQSGEYAQVLGLSRSQSLGSAPALDITDEASISAGMQWLAEQCTAKPLRCVIVATGFLHQWGGGPERSLAHLDAEYLAQVFAVNSIGPALLLKHLAPIMPREGAVKLVFISAKVGSIGDNALGGWYGYRASKAALNQIVKTASIELARRNKQLCCVALHPGTVQTPLSEPFGKSGLKVRAPDVAAQEIMQVIGGLDASANGSFIDYQGAHWARPAGVF
jgi:NAD(P)-dependent dehydrogenase (short-subunit alcohol dehydrogenase family)